MLATYLLSNWKNCKAAIDNASHYSDSPAPVIRCMFDQLLSYAKRHQTIFRDEAAATNFAGSFSPYHRLLRSQLAAPVQKYCSSDFMAEFIAKSLLT